ncbi:hypothetical protein T484DRAFT_1917074 [Baffinella frigidus]|nr:hypothetical protein T484DRAFT_1917074 [Cryptophyta sp. CCMP2293]
MSGGEVRPGFMCPATASSERSSQYAPLIYIKGGHLLPPGRTAERHLDYVGALQEIKDGPYQSGEDLRFMEPKQGGVGNVGGYNAVGRGLMGDEHGRAWWPAPPVHRQVRPGKGGTRLENTAPFAMGPSMEMYDRRTFGPQYTREQWASAHRELKANPGTVGEMERTLKQGLTRLASRLNASASQAASVTSGGAARSAAMSQNSTAARQRAREGSVAASEGVRPSTARTDMTVPNEALEP